MTALREGNRNVWFSPGAPVRYPLRHCRFFWGRADMPALGLVWRCLTDAVEKGVVFAFSLGVAPLGRTN
jgi:hypothetical protein